MYISRSAATQCCSHLFLIATSLRVTGTADVQCLCTVYLYVFIILNVQRFYSLSR